MCCLLQAKSCRNNSRNLQLREKMYILIICFNVERNESELTCSVPYWASSKLLHYFSHLLHAHPGDNSCSMCCLASSTSFGGMRRYLRLNEVLPCWSLWCFIILQFPKYVSSIENTSLLICIRWRSFCLWDSFNTLCTLSWPRLGSAKTLWMLKCGGTFFFCFTSFWIHPVTDWRSHKTSVVLSLRSL